MNEDARPVTILFGDENGELKTGTKQKKIQNIELMLRTPTPFPNLEPNIIPQGEHEDMFTRYSNPHDSVDATSVERVSSGVRKSNKPKDESFNRKFNNRLKLEAFVNVGARLVIGESSRSSSSGSYKFQCNRPVSRTLGGDYDLSAPIDTENVSQTIVYS